MIGGEISLNSLRCQRMFSTHDPGAKYEIVQPRPSLRNFRRQYIDIADETEIRAEKIYLVVAGCLAQLAHSGRALFGVAADKDDTDACLGEHARDRLADSVSAAGHQRDPPLARVFARHHHVLPAALWTAAATRPNHSPSRSCSREAAKRHFLV